jgi:hypothetical protein
MIIISLGYVMARGISASRSINSYLLENLLLLPTISRQRGADAKHLP